MSRFWLLCCCECEKGARYSICCTETLEESSTTEPRTQHDHTVRCHPHYQFPPDRSITHSPNIGQTRKR